MQRKIEWRGENEDWPGNQRILACDANGWRVAYLLDAITRSTYARALGGFCRISLLTGLKPTELSLILPMGFFKARP
jgi:hypothetical protein